MGEVQNAGVGVYSEYFTTENSNSFDAKVTAVFEALKAIKDRSGPNIVIFIYSQATISAVTVMHVSRPLNVFN